MKSGLSFLFGLIGLTFIYLPSVFAVTVTDSHGEFTIHYQPNRIIALEFSFVDALASVNVSPVGIADDDGKNVLLPATSEKLGHWQSVGLRSQPSLEVIASLKPDLIIADADRHAGIYDALNQIAPTLLLPSRRETYASNLKSARIIGAVIGKEEEITQRLIQHHALMQGYKLKLQQAHIENKIVQFGVARENVFYAHSEDSYTGGVINALGLKMSPILKNEQGSRQIGFEQLLAINPDYLIVGDSVANSIMHRWQQLPLWHFLKSVQNRQVYYVEGDVWVQYRGIIAAEHMAEDLMQFISPRE